MAALIATVVVVVLLPAALAIYAAERREAVRARVRPADRQRVEAFIASRGGE